MLRLGSIPKLLRQVSQLKYSTNREEMARIKMTHSACGNQRGWEGKLTRLTSLLHPHLRDTRHLECQGSPVSLVTFGMAPDI